MIELLVSTGIIVLILGLVFYSYPRFKARSSLSALARDVGLLVREAQVYGLAVKEFPATQSQFPPYGIHVSLDKPKEIILFGDTSGGATCTANNACPDGIYESGDGCGATNTECIRRITITGPEFVSKLCVIATGGEGSGGFASQCDNIRELNVTFKRPDPEAIIYTDSSATRYNGAEIHMRSAQNSPEEKVIKVWITGQISIP